MLKIEVIQFEAQDVIASSVPCSCVSICFTGKGNEQWSHKSYVDCDCEADEHVRPES